MLRLFLSVILQYLCYLYLWLVVLQFIFGKVIYCITHVYIVLSNFSAKVLEVTDQRVKLMSEIIKSMRIVKMYCWESAFERQIRLLRK
jgi:hypothetical protein